MTLWRGLCRFLGHAWSGTTWDDDGVVTTYRRCHRCGAERVRFTIPQPPSGSG